MFDQGGFSLSNNTKAELFDKLQDQRIGSHDVDHYVCFDGAVEAPGEVLVTIQVRFNHEADGPTRFVAYSPSHVGFEEFDGDDIATPLSYLLKRIAEG